MSDLLDRFLSPPQGAAPTGDPLDAEIAQEAQQRATAAMRANTVAPDAAGKALQIAQSTGLPFETVVRNLSTLAKDDEDVRSRMVVGKYPPLAAWASDPTHAALAGDDLAALAKNAEYWRKSLRGSGNLTAPAAPAPTLWNSVSGIAISFAQSAKQVGNAIQMLGADYLPSFEPPKAKGVPGFGDYGIENSIRRYDQSQTRMDDAQPAFKSNYARYLYGGTSSLAQMLPAVGTALVTGGVGGLAVAGAQTGLPAYSKYRARGGTKGEALLGGALEGGIEVATEKLPLGFLVDNLLKVTGKSGVSKFVAGYLGRELPTEMAATLGQNIVDTAIANPDKTWAEFAAEQPDQLMQTAVGTLIGTGFFGAVHKSANVLAARNGAVGESVDAAQFIDGAMQAAAESKTRQRAPGAFQSFIDRMSQGTQVENLYVPAQSVASYFQSQGMDYHDGEFWGDYASQIDEALVTGGDVAIPTATAVSHLAGTPEWEAIKGDTRASPGGMSLSEAESFHAEMDDHMQAMGEVMSEQFAADEAAKAPRDKLYQSVRDKLTNAGFTQSAAGMHAEMVAQRYATRAERNQTTLTGNEADSLHVNQVLPEGLAPIIAAQPDAPLDVALKPVIAAMRGKKAVRSEKARFGPSLIDFVRSAGGIDDIGGDLAAIGFGKTKGASKKGQIKLIRKSRDEVQAAQGASLLGADGQQNTNTPDELAMRAWEAGYFPNLSERPDVNAPLDALAEGNSGRHRYANDDTNDNDQIRIAAQELYQILDQQGIDPDKATDKQIAKAVEAYRQASADGLRQIDPRSTAFKAWFGDSKVVDKDGRPLVVHHGTAGEIDAFDPKKRGQLTGAQSAKGAFWFSDRPKTADYYAEAATREANMWRSRDEKLQANKVDVYLSMQNPLIVDMGGKVYRETSYGDLIEKAKSQGNDGLIIKRTYDAGEYGRFDAAMRGRFKSETIFAAFEPTQIKSVDNRGTFDPNDSRILHQSLFEDPKQPERTMTPEQRAELKARQKQGMARRGGQVGLGDQTGGLFSTERDQGALFQTYADGPRGQISFTTDGKNVIDLFQARDPSTFIHETGHLYLEELRADAEHDNASDQLKNDWQAVQEWFAANGHPLTDGAIPTEAHELWARGWERFAMEGKSPTPVLRRVFDAFRSWLLNVYQVVENLRAPITPEIREVMQRLIATDQEIEEATARQNIGMLFESATAAKAYGVDEASYEALRKTASEARNEAMDALLYRTMSTIRESRTKAWKDEAEAVRADVTTAVNRRPEFKALHLLRTGKLLDNPEAAPIRARLDRQWLVDTYGEDVIAQLPDGVPPIWATKDTVNADSIAEMTGFATGDEMVRTLIGLETRRKELREGGDKRTVRQVLIDEEVTAEMRDRHGDPLNDGSIEEEALAAVHNEKQGELIAAELRALGRVSKRRATPYSVAKEYAARVIAEGKVNDTISGNAIQIYARAARNAAKAAQAAILERNVDEAFVQSQRQMLNNALVAEAGRVREKVDAAVSRLGKWAKRATIKSVDQDYLDQAHAMLEQTDFRPASQASLDRRESFEAWAKAQTENGHDITVEPSFADSLGKTHWSRLTVEKLLGLDDAVSQIIHLGRQKQTLIDGKEKREFDALVDEGVVAVGNLPPRPPTDNLTPTFGEQLKGKVLAFDAALLKVETLVDWLDQGRSDGVFNRIVFKPIADAQARAGDMFQATMAKLNTALSAVPVKDLKRWGDRVSIPELTNRETGNAFSLTRQQLISMALNVGNEGNSQRLADGYGWNEQTMLTVLNRELSADEWTYVQSVWDAIEELWPEIEAMEKRVNGVAPEKVAARPVATPGGTLRGGYFPAVYDATRDYQSEQNAARESDLFSTQYTRANTRSSATKDRAEKVSRPILLDLGVVTRHIGEVIHDITHREAIMNADKFLSSKRIMAAIDNTLGREARQQFRPWLKFVANQWASERAGNEGVGKFINKLRTNATVVGMGFRVSTIMMQLAGYSNSFEVVGAKHVTAAIAQTSAHPVETFKFVMGRSDEIRHRMDTLDRDIDQAAKRLAGKAGKITEVKRFAFHGIGMMDRMVVIPTWIGAYNKALTEGMTDDAAAYAADKAVRQSQGAGAAKDLAAISRGTGKWGEAMKLMTMFYSYCSAVYQRQRTLGRDVRAASSSDIPGLMARAWWLAVVPPLLSELMGGRGPDDDEDWGAWAIKQMLFQSLSAIPIVRDAARPIWDALAGKRAFDYQLSPLQRSGQSVVEVAKDVGNLAQGKQTKHATKNALEAVGYWTGLVPGQVAASTQFLVDVGMGDAQPRDLGDWWTGFTKGRISEAKAS